MERAAKSTKTKRIDFKASAKATVKVDRPLPAHKPLEIRV